MHRGISIIELIAVIAIILILSSVSLVVWQAYGSSLRLTLSARKIIGDLRQAQSQSVTEQITYLIRFDKKTSTYKYICLIPDPDNPGETMEEEIRQENLYSKIQISEINGLDNDQVRFNPAGAPSDTGTIQLKNEKGAPKTIEIKPSGWVKS